MKRQLVKDSLCLSLPLSCSLCLSHKCALSPSLSFCLSLFNVSMNLIPTVHHNVNPLLTNVTRGHRPTHAMGTITSMGKRINQPPRNNVSDVPETLDPTSHADNQQGWRSVHSLRHVQSESGSTLRIQSPSESKPPRNKDRNSTEPCQQNTAFNAADIMP